MIDWIGSEFGGSNVSVNPDAMTVTIDGEETKADVCNVIRNESGAHCGYGGVRMAAGRL